MTTSAKRVAAEHVIAEAMCLSWPVLIEVALRRLNYTLTGTDGIGNALIEAVERRQKRAA